MKIYLSLFFSLVFAACSTPKTFDPSLIRKWSKDLEKQEPTADPYVAHHENGGAELYYLAAHHSTDPESKTMKLVEKLFAEFKFDALIIEPFPYVAGKNPIWFIEHAEKTGHKGGESAVAVLRAREKQIPIFGGEPDHQVVYISLKQQEYTDQDILGFYLARQIPQWVREGEVKKGLVARKAPAFLAHYCQLFGIEKSQCPGHKQIQKWYTKNNGKPLDARVSTEDVAPYGDGPLLTQRISAAIGEIRDSYTLMVIEDLLKKHERVAVVYGASHYLTLKNSLESVLGVAEVIK